uniref:histone deacetylase n=1 Tax=Syphacia muris TaxID=451379 RepID=A0A0N5ANR4_9BILA
MSSDNVEGFSSNNSNFEPLPLEISTDVSAKNKTPLLQQLQQRETMDLLTEFQSSRTNFPANLQHLSCLQLLRQVKQQQCSSSQVAQPTTRAVCSISENITESETQQMSPTSRSEGHSGRIRRSLHRSLSSSAQTISQTTRDRLKNMIALKKNRNKAENSSGLSSSAVSSSWIQSAIPSSSSGIHFKKVTKIKEIILILNIFCTDSWSHVENCSKQHINSPLATSVPAITVAVSSPHYEPYPLPVITHASRATLSPEHQLRKVNSEPNLKMRIRAKLLSKGSSPVQAHQNSAFSYPHSLERSESDVPMDTGLNEANLVDRGSSLITAPVLQSPSLPNLIGNQLQMEMSALFAQAQLSQFLSMPSLYKNSFAVPSCSGWNPGNSESEGCLRNCTKLDAREVGQSLPFGGYQSLLKQQIRDLILRRKSLVREEPEDEAAVETQLLSKISSGSAVSLPSEVSNVIRFKTGLVYDSSMVKHQCICGNNGRHVEHGGRIQSIWSRLQERGLIDRCERVAVRKASLDTLRTMHSYNYVTFFAVSPTAFMKGDNSQIPVKSFVQLPCGGLGVDTDTYFNDATTPLAIKTAVGSLVELISQVAEGTLRNGFACIRPPGHHAEYNQAMGFCFVNNVAIAVKHLQQHYRKQCPRVAIIDWDVHHGNGTQSLFESDPSVLYISLHRHDYGNFFPGTGAVTEVGTGKGKGYTVNIPFSGEPMSDADYLAAWRVVVMPILQIFQPSFIMVSAGFDAAKGHPAALGGYDLSPQIFGFFTRQLMEFADGRVVLALEGGYDLAAISDSAEECVKVLCGISEEAGKLSVEALNDIPKLSAQEAIQKAVAIHKKHWPLLKVVQGIGISELCWQSISQRFSALSV